MSTLATDLQDEKLCRRNDAINKLTSLVDAIAISKIQKHYPLTHPPTGVGAITITISSKSTVGPSQYTKQKSSFWARKKVNGKVDGLDWMDGPLMVSAL